MIVITCIGALFLMALGLASIATAVLGGRSEQLLEEPSAPRLLM